MPKFRWLAGLAIVALLAGFPGCGDGGDDDVDAPQAGPAEPFHAKGAVVETPVDSAGDGFFDDDDDNDGWAPPSPVYGYYQEAIHEDWDWMHAQLDVFAEFGLAMFLGIPSHLIGDENLLAFFEDAAGRGVEVRAWLLLPRDEGYWPSENNVESFSRIVDGFVDWIDGKAVDIGWIVVDMEMGVDRIYPLQDLFNSGEYVDALRFLLDQRDPEDFAAASAGYQRIVDRLHDRSMRAMVVTYPQVLDDLEDGDTSLQDLMEIPVSTVAWDEVSTMPYSAEWAELFGLPFGPYLTYSYGRSTVKHFGDRASIAVGVSGYMDDPSRLAAEIAAAKAAGIERIQVYSYRGCWIQDDPALWHQAFEAFPEVPPSDGATDLIRTLISLGDGLI